MFYFTVSKPGLRPVSGKQLSVLKAKAQQHCSSWRKKGKWRWSGLISFVSRCIHFVFFPTPTSPLSVRPLIRNWTPQWQIEPAIKKRKRKALLSAADWDPRLPSHIRGVCSACKCVCTCACILGAQPKAVLTQPPLLRFPPLSRCSHGLHFCSECSANKTVSMQLFSHLSHTRTCTWIYTGKTNIHVSDFFSLEKRSPLIFSVSSLTICSTELKSVNVCPIPGPCYWPSINQPWPVSKCSRADLRGGGGVGSALLGRTVRELTLTNHPKRA